MDALTSHLLGKIDQMQDRQRDHGEILNRILTALERDTEPGPPAPKLRLIDRIIKLPPLSQMIIGGAASWGIGTAISSYLSHGGDPMALIEALLKLLF